MREGAVYADCVKLLKARQRAGWQVWWVKVHGGPYQETGVPDLIVCCFGRFVGVELKRTELGREVT